VIDEYSADGTGWARFSDDRQMRYRLARRLTDRPGAALCFMNLTEAASFRVSDPIESEAKRYVFLMLNPSTADAFVLDPTVKRCVAFATSWGADVLEVVNIFALRSTDPRELYKRAFTFRGDDQVANDQIILACRGAHRVIAGWGRHGALDHRGNIVRSMLAEHGIALYHLGLNKDGSPKHPLYIEGGTAPQEWNVDVQHAAFPGVIK